MYKKYKKTTKTHKQTWQTERKVELNCGFQVRDHTKRGSITLIKLIFGQKNSNFANLQPFFIIISLRGSNPLILVRELLEYEINTRVSN